MRSKDERSLLNLSARVGLAWLVGVFPILATRVAKGSAPAAASGTQSLAPQVDACSLVKAADVAELLGEPATCSPAPKGTSSVWQGTDPQRKLAILTYSNRAPGEMVYMGAQNGAMKDTKAKFADEPGLGDKAFSITSSFGAAFVMLKGGRVLQLQFLTGAQGAAEDRDALRTIARKAIRAF